MTTSIRVALAQANPIVGDVSGSINLALSFITKADAAGADIVIFPELMVSGYPPEDLLTRKRFINRCENAIKTIADATLNGPAALIGAPVVDNGVLKNTACILAGGKWQGSIFKQELPNYGVFDEQRYFEPGANGPLVKIGPAVAGVTICEDIWVENNILCDQAKCGANLSINISGSPYWVDAHPARKNIVERNARRFKTPFVYCNLVGGQDELVFDGRSFVCDENGEVVALAEAFSEDLLVIDINVNETRLSIKRETIDISVRQSPKPPVPIVKRHEITSENEEIYEAIALGLKDYVDKNGFKTVVVASSGGIDSALTLVIAVDALGPSRVRSVSMPSPYSSEGSVTDANKLSENLGVEMISMPIGDLMDVYDKTLENVFKDREKDITEENIQARIRGALIMALSNKFGWLVLSTGNKSEIAVGYCTLYGDMAGGFAVIKDLLKTRVYDLCRWRNEKEGRDLIPQSIIAKEPSAELRPDQRDTDSLPEYSLLDPILKEYIEKNRDVDEIEKLGYSRQLVAHIATMVDRNEYKRRQGPMGVKITVKAFGKDRRRPVTCKFIEE